MSLIPTDFSITSCTASFIHSQRECETKQPVIRFVQRELLTRTTTVAMSVFALIDVAIHLLGMVESTVYALYRGAVKQQIPDFSSLHKHFRCVLIFLRIFPFISINSTINPRLNFSENKDIECTNVLLLSRDPNYSKNCVVTPLLFVEYLQKHTAQLDPDHLKGMEDSLELLNDAKRFLSEKKFSKTKKFFDTDIKPTSKLSKVIESLRDYQGSFIKTVFFKEFLARLLSLGLSFSCAFELMIIAILESIIILNLTIIDSIYGKRVFFNNWTDVLKFILTHFRDILIKTVGVITGSIVGSLLQQNALFYKKKMCR